MTMRPFHRRLVAMAGLAALLVSATGCSSGGSGDGVLRLGLITDMSGASSLFGESTQMAAQLAVDEVNAAGGVAGSQLELIVGDEAADPSVAVSVAQRMIEQDSVVALFGQHNSASRDAILPIAQAEDLPYFYTPVSEGAACASNLFITGEVPSQQLSETLAWTQEETGKKRWFLLGNDMIWPRATFEAAKTYIEEAGGEVVGEEYVPLGTTDFQSVISKIRASGADVMIPAVIGSDAITFEKQAYDAGLGNDAVQRLAVLYEDNTRAALGAEIAAGMFNAVGYDSAIDSAENAAFLEAYYAANGDDAPVPTTISIQSYIAIKAWAAAANEAGSTDLASLSEKLVGETFDTPAGEITYQESHYVAKPIVITDTQADGSVVVVQTFPKVEATESCTP